MHISASAAETERIGSLFAAIGSLFSGVGVIVLFSGNDILLGTVVIAMGGASFAIGITLIHIAREKRREVRALKEKGRCIIGEIVALEKITIGNTRRQYKYRPYFYVRVRYMDENRNVYLFDSENRPDLGRYIGLKGCKVKIYVEDETYQHYHVDIDALLK